MRRRIRSGAPFMACALLVVACSNNFDPASYVTGLRVLAIKAEPPEIAPNEQAQLTPVFTDTVSREGISFDWQSCLLAPTPNDTSTINHDCLNPPPQPYLTSFGNAETAQVTMPDVLPTALGQPDATLGFYLPVRFTLNGPGGAGPGTVVAFYRLRYGLGHGLPPNHNPRFMGLFVVPSGASADADAGAGALMPLDELTPEPLARGESITLRPLFTSDSAESFPVLDPAHPTQPKIVTEQLRISFYATAGSFSEETTGQSKPDTVFRLDKHVPPVGTTIDLWAIGTDERGGTDSLHRVFVVTQ